MNNAIDISLSQIYNTIPRELLELAFRDPSDPASRYAQLHEVIINKVINGRILKDCNVFGGKPKLITLQLSFMEPGTITQTEQIMGLGSYCLYRIPPEEREHVPITEVASCHYPGYMNVWPGHHPYASGSSLVNMAQDVLQSHTFSNAPPTPIPELLAGDLVRLNPPQHHHLDWVVNCRLGYDQQFSNLNVSAIRPLAQVAEHATKAYIYNKLIIQLDKAYIVGGAEMGSVLRIVEGYADSEARYIELLDQFSGSTKLDPMTMRTILQYAL